MPHVMVKLVPGKSEEQKLRLTEAITRDVAEVLGYEIDAISVGIEEVFQEDWRTNVYFPDIRAKISTLYKKPGYQM